MRQLINKEKFCEILTNKLEEKDYNPEGFVETEMGQIIINLLIDVPIENKMYSEEDIDYYIKIILRLTTKFNKELLKGYGASEYVFTMLDTLYKEQNKIMPDKWYNYCYWQKIKGQSFYNSTPYFFTFYSHIVMLYQLSSLKLLQFHYGQSHSGTPQ